jgi:hypothetical protein
MRRLLLSFLMLLPMMAHSTDKARIAVVGDADTFNIGQDGFCGARQFVDRTSWQSIFVDGGTPVFFHVKSKAYGAIVRSECEGDNTFVPAAGSAYIVRFSHEANRCVTELFRVVSGADPVREKLTMSPAQPCIAK